MQTCWNPTVVCEIRSRKGIWHKQTCLIHKRIHRQVDTKYPPLATKLGSGWKLVRALTRYWSRCWCWRHCHLSSPYWLASSADSSSPPLLQPPHCAGRMLCLSYHHLLRQIKHITQCHSNLHNTLIHSAWFREFTRNTKRNCNYFGSFISESLWWTVSNLHNAELQASACL